MNIQKIKNNKSKKNLNNATFESLANDLNKVKSDHETLRNELAEVKINNESLTNEREKLKGDLKIPNEKFQALLEANKGLETIKSKNLDLKIRVPKLRNDMLRFPHGDHKLEKLVTMCRPSGRNLG